MTQAERWALGGEKCGMGACGVCGNGHIVGVATLGMVFPLTNSRVLLHLPVALKSFMSAPASARAIVLPTPFFITLLFISSSSVLLHLPAASESTGPALSGRRATALETVAGWVTTLAIPGT